MTDSILTTIKKMLNLSEDNNGFDHDIIIHVNNSFFNLYQMGVGPSSPFVISGVDETWSDFDESIFVESVKTYVYAKVRLAFDPPASSIHIEMLKEVAREAETRLRDGCELQESEVTIQNGI